MNLTYLGSFDDRSIAYSNNSELNIHSLNDILFSELLYSDNSKIVINDGYLVNSPILIDALTKTPPPGESLEDFHYRQSPLFSMLKNKRVSVLGRKGSLLRAVEHMIAEDNRIFNRIKERKDWKKSIELLDTDLEGCFMDWPKKNTSHGFIKLMGQLLKKEPEELGLKINSYLFERIGKQFLEQVERNTDGPRNQWELIVNEYSDYEVELMELANRAYHYNFGMCLKAGNPNADDVRVHSIASDLFTDRTETPLSRRDLELLNFSLPRGFRINDDFINLLCQPGELRTMHRSFVKACNKYIDGKVEPSDLEEIQTDFRQLMGSEARRLYRADNEELAWWSIGFSLTGGVMSYNYSSDPMVSLVATIVGTLPGGVSIIQDRRRFRGKGEVLPFMPNALTLDNLKLSGEKADFHAENLPDYVPQ